MVYNGLEVWHDDRIFILQDWIPCLYRLKIRVVSTVRSPLESAHLAAGFKPVTTTITSKSLAQRVESYSLLHSLSFFSCISYVYQLLRCEIQRFVDSYGNLVDVPFSFCTFLHIDPPPSLPVPRQNLLSVNFDTLLVSQGPQFPMVP